MNPDETVISFHITRAEDDRSRPFIEEHQKLHGEYAGSIGGRYSYRFTSTSLGTVAVIKCACGAELNLTDYDEW